MEAIVLLRELGENGYWVGLGKVASSGSEGKGVISSIVFVRKWPESFRKILRRAEVAKYCNDSMDLLVDFLRVSCRDCRSEQYCVGILGFKCFKSLNLPTRVWLEFGTVALESVWFNEFMGKGDGKNYVVWNHVIRETREDV